MHPFNAGRTPESGITRHTIQTTFNVKNGCLNVYSIPNLITLQSIQSIIAEIQYPFRASNIIQYLSRAISRLLSLIQSETKPQSSHTNQ